jgi:hypothetical protein
LVLDGRLDHRTRCREEEEVAKEKATKGQTMVVGEKVSHRAVCEYLLTSSGCGDLSSLSDEEIHRAMVAFGQKNPGNPAVVWLGYSPRDGRRAAEWARVSEIDVRQFFSRGLNSEWKAVLELVQGNLFRFVTECQDTYKGEYDPGRILLPALSLIIGVVHPGRGDEIELVDGSHRLANMILNGAQRVMGYIGRY